MADDFWSRKRRQEERESEEREKETERREREALKNKRLGFTVENVDARSNSFENLVKEATTLIEQLNHLYNQFKTGLLVLPPVQKRERLTTVMNHLTMAPKPTPSDRFYFSSVHSSFESHCSRWDKMLHDLETGKIKRTAGPVRRGG